MKRFLILFMMAAFVALALTSCKETLPARFDRFVNGVEKRCANFSEDDWKKANEHFGKLVDEYTQNRSSYTAENIILLGETGSGEEVARNLYSALRKCDDLEADLIFSEAFNRDKYGGAIMNRLLKAAGQKVILV